MEVDDLRRLMNSTNSAINVRNTIPTTNPAISPAMREIGAGELEVGTGELEVDTGTSVLGSFPVNEDNTVAIFISQGYYGREHVYVYFNTEEIPNLIRLCHSCTYIHCVCI